AYVLANLVGGIGQLLGHEIVMSISFILGQAVAAFLVVRLGAIVAPTKKHVVALVLTVIICLHLWMPVISLVVTPGFESNQLLSDFEPWELVSASIAGTITSVVECLHRWKRRPVADIGSTSIEA
ncbi:MAG: hypothetical protein K8F91_25000, partial [Candidatus Obscuribacterales bacterium]|nr:hypothetical protein [Candidatus Obscuribacterales bacterium]